MRRPTRPARDGFSLVELLVVIAVISILLAISIPAVQRVRESARGADCKSRLRQLGISGQHGAVQGSADAVPKSALHENQDEYLWNCPSAGTVRKAQSASSVDDAAAIFAVTHLRIKSGRAGSEEELLHADDGFYAHRDLRRVEDGTSHTVMIGDGIADPKLISPLDPVDCVDHWIDGFGRQFDASGQFLGITNPEQNHSGSTGVPINLVRRKSGNFAAQEISLGSFHPAHINVLFVDGHVKSISESIAAPQWSALGTSSGSDDHGAY